ncbi:MAG: SDR family NAD(P)-dependent oxidoreductase, partial [Kangiellaceae bacterium]|nr:SDR family NAD(P)-dependent oxidoreductase [Kangiellaceae bacterium]
MVGPKELFDFIEIYRFMPSQQKNLEESKPANKVALITGAAKRIGKQIAKELHQRHIDIVIHYRDSENEARDLCNELNHTRKNSAHIVQADLTASSADQKLFQRALKCFNRLDYLVNNASIFYPTPFMQDNEEVINSLLIVNSSFPAKLIEQATAELKENKGAI